MDIRNGKLPFDEIFNLAKNYQATFHKSAESTKLPYEPDTEAIDRLMIKLYEMSR